MISIIKAFTDDDFNHAKKLFIEYSESLGISLEFQNFDEELNNISKMYVQPNWKGKGIGKMLTKAIIEEAKVRGYRFMRLDTLPSMKQAISLYQTLGFYPIEPYRFNPIEGALYMELDLLNK